MVIFDFFIINDYIPNIGDAFNGDYERFLMAMQNGRRSFLSSLLISPGRQFGGEMNRYAGLSL
jgi:hypothetical protein